ncbi:MAG TPA: hypothetical protein ENK67_01950 [Flavobacteriia bacterium]|nr:hypothetical protein [Flavobacteriia bacterium]
MKNSILIIATVVLTFFNSFATTTSNGNPVNLNSNKVVKIYDWDLEVKNGKFSGTSLSMDDAQKILKLLSKGELVLNKQIISYYVLQSDSLKNNYRNYYWEVQTETGYAKGFASTKQKARELISLVAIGDIIRFKIVESKPVIQK